MTLAADDYDSPWKEALEQYLADCLALFFPAVHADVDARLAELEANRNPFAAIVLAHLKAQETHGNLTERYAAKFAVLRRLYDLGTIMRRFCDCTG